MSKNTYPLKLPDSVKKAAQRLAKEDGVSLNQWISAAVAQKVGAVETAAAFFERDAQPGDGGRKVAACAGFAGIVANGGGEPVLKVGIEAVLRLARLQVEKAEDQGAGQAEQ